MAQKSYERVFSRNCRAIQSVEQEKRPRVRGCCTDLMSTGDRGREKQNYAKDANQPVARHFNSVPFLVATIAAKDRNCVSFPNLEPYTPLVLTSVFPSFGVTCLRLTCSDIGRSNPTFVFVVLLALCLPSHITPIFNPVYKI